MEIVVDKKTRQMIFKPADDYFLSNHFYDTSKSLKDLASSKESRKKQQAYFQEKRNETLPYFITVVMNFDVYWATEQWIIDTLSGKWTRKFDGRVHRDSENPDYTNYATFWFEKAEDCIAFKLRFG